MLLTKERLKSIHEQYQQEVNEYEDYKSLNGGIDPYVELGNRWIGAIHLSLVIAFVYSLYRGDIFPLWFIITTGGCLVLDMVFEITYFIITTIMLVISYTRQGVIEPVDLEDYLAREIDNLTLGEGIHKKMASILTNTALKDRRYDEAVKIYNESEQYGKKEIHNRRRQ